MKKIIPLMMMAFVLSSCSLFLPHKPDIEQGNIITSQEVSRLHRGMSESQVKNVMGNPVLMNIFSQNRMEYIYTFQEGYGERSQKHVTCIFQNGVLRDIERG